MHKVPGRAITEAAVPGLNTDSSVAHSSGLIWDERMQVIFENLVNWVNKVN